VFNKKKLIAVSLKAGRSFGFVICLLAMMKSNVAIYAQKPQKPVSPLVADRGKISYNPDSLGNRIPDFSWCGYMASNEAIPAVPVKIVVPVAKGDATLRIQSAIDYVSSLLPDQNAFRGAVLLQK
jgi:hypothetical protein